MGKNGFIINIQEKEVYQMYIERAGFPQKKKIIIFTGAGISSESGISTFRDSNGLWENHKIEDVCNINTWEKNYDLVHEFYNKRRTQLKDVKPNLAHKTVKEIFEQYPEDTFVITQKVDDLFERSGMPSDKVLHLHGELSKMQCQHCFEVYDIGYTEYKIGDNCPNCNGNTIKPKIVFFQE